MKKSPSNKRYKMNRLFFLLLILTTLFFFTTGTRGNTLPPPNPAIWEVTSDTGTVYLIGAIPFGNEKFYPLNDKIEALFQKSDKLVVEVDLTKVDAEALNLSILGEALYPGEDTIEQHLSEEEFALLEATLAGFGIPAIDLIKFRPWFLNIMIESIQYQILGFNSELGLDLYFLNQAGDKEILSLETAEFQATLFAQFSEETEKMLLIDTLTSDLEKRTRDLVAAWLSGDLRTIENIVYQDLLKDPAYLGVYEKVCFRRSRIIAEKIAEYIKTGDTYFTIIEAGLLVGEKGIINLLQQKGFNINLL